MGRMSQVSSQPEMTTVKVSLELHPKRSYCLSGGSVTVNQQNTGLHLMQTLASRVWRIMATDLPRLWILRPPVARLW